MSMAMSFGMDMNRAQKKWEEAQAKNVNGT
jgi:hypothetical protein